MWKGIFQRLATLKAERCFGRPEMGRLANGERQLKENQLVFLLQRCFLGLREAEIAEELGWDRRTVNNYLRMLREQGRVYKEGRLWQVEE